MPDPDARSGGELVPLGGTIDDDQVSLEPRRFEALAAAQETEAVELLAGVFAAAATRRAAQRPLKEAA
jgi:hypothetical protein